MHLDIIKAYYLTTVLIYRIPSSSTGCFFIIVYVVLCFMYFCYWGHPRSLSAALFRAQMGIHTKFCKLFILFHIRTVHLDIIKHFYLTIVLIYHIP